jgi:two-component system sensor histidine kinase KdpD
MIFDNKNIYPDRARASVSKADGAFGRRGKLKIFFGMSPGVGKTYAMLQAAHQDSLRGVDVVVGCARTHDRPETGALLEQLEVIPCKKTERRGSFIPEMDLDAIISRHPYIVLVDDLAHVNTRGSRHARRYQDVQELLDNGINVCTTLNMQQLESRRDTSRLLDARDVAGVPDEIFESADDIVLADITPNLLLDRLAEGKVHVPSHLQKNANEYFSKQNIIARREMSLRIVAEKVNMQLRTHKKERTVEGRLESDLRLMVLTGSGKSSERLIRIGKRLSYAMGMELLVLHVENTALPDAARVEQLSKNIDLARELGAKVIITAGNDIVATTMDVVRKEDITHMIAGRPKKRRGSLLARLFPKGYPVGRLYRECRGVDFFVVEPPESEPPQRKGKRASSSRIPNPCLQCLVALSAVLFVTALCLPVATKAGYQSVSFILLFVVLMLSMFFRFWPVMTASIVSALAWDFFFIPPQYTFNITKPEDILALVAFLVVALVTGTLTSKLRKQEQFTRRQEKKTSALFHLTDRLAAADNTDDIFKTAREDIKKYFGVSSYVVMQDGSGRLELAGEQCPWPMTDLDRSIAQWVLRHSNKAGRHTSTLSASEYTFYPLKGIQTKPGIIIVSSKKKFNGETELFWNTFLTQISNALEHQCLILRNKKANLMYESDKLYRTIFNSVSHELRIPVATVMGAADTLMVNEYPENIRKELYSQIFAASGRLNHLIDNLLNISRIESHKIAPRIDWCEVGDLFNHVVDNLAEELKPFKVEVAVPPSMPLVRLDFGLMEQALHNLVYNSCKYAHPGGIIRLKAFYDNGYLVIQQMDRGPGFPEDALPHVFNKFFKGDNHTSGGLGLGLSITKGFVKAHKGTIGVENRMNGGVCFTIKIPTEISYSDNLPAKHDEQ